MRDWPVPPEDRTLHLLGDTHIGGVTQSRLDIVTADMARPAMPSLPFHLQMGDRTDAGTTVQDTAAATFLDSIGGEWKSVVGNHDVASGRTADAAAAAWGQTADFVQDLGYAVVIGLGFDAIDGTGMWFKSSTLDWLNARLLENQDRICFLAAHPPLYETVGTGDDAFKDYVSTETFFYALDDDGVGDDGLRAVIADNPNAKAWLSGHTHSLLYANRIVYQETIGGHSFGHINASAIFYTGRTVEWTDRLVSAFVTVRDDTHLDVRYRNHGAHQWVNSGKERQPVWTIDLG